MLAMIQTYNVKTDLISTLETMIDQQDMNIYQLSKLTNINSGTMTHIFNRTRALTIQNLFSILDVLKMDYTKYMMSYAIYCSVHQEEQPVRWRTIHPFMNHCLENGYLEEMKIVLNNLERYSEMNWGHKLIKVGEEYRLKADVQLLKILYRHIIKIAPLNNRLLAICYYRLFLLAQKEDLRTQNEMVIHLKTFMHELPENMYMNALLRVATHYFKVKQWDEMERYSDLLITASQTAYQLQKKGEIAEELDEPLERKLVKYYGQGYLLKSSANRNRGAETENQADLEKALKLIEGYSDLSWFPNLDEEGLLEVERFKFFAEGNMYHTQLLMGNKDIIFDNLRYLEKHIEKHPEEMLPGYVIIIESANKFNFEVSEYVIEKIVKLINQYESIANHHVYYEKGKQDSEYIQLTYELANYLISNNRFGEGFESALNCLELSIRIRSDRFIVDSIGVLEKIKFLVSADQIQKYDQIREGLIKK